MLRFILHKLRQNEEGMFQFFFSFTIAVKMLDMCVLLKKVKLQYTLYVALLNIKDDRK